MSDVGSGLPVYRGAWADQPYLRGDLVLRSGALYQAINNTASQPGGTADISGKGNPAAWVNVTALVLDFTGSEDPTTGSGIPAAISSTYHMAGSGLYVKSDTGVTDWESTGGGGGAVQQVSLLGPYTFHYNDAGIDDNGVEVADLPIGAVLISTWLVPTVEWLLSDAGVGEIQAYVSISTSQGGTAVKYPTWGGLVNPYGEAYSADPTDRPAHFILHTTEAKHSLVVSVYPPENVFTQGEGEAWALVATPA